MAAKPDGLFGGLFDFNGDSKTDIAEEFLAYKMFEAVTAEAEEKEFEEDEDET